MARSLCGRRAGAASASGDVEADLDGRSGLGGTMVSAKARLSALARSAKRLQGVHPDLVRVFEHALYESPVSFIVGEGKRDKERQRLLFEKGATLTMDSKHLEQRDGYAHAIDVIAVGDLDGDGDVDAQDGTRTWDREVYTQIAYAFDRAAAALGVRIRWGGRFKKFFDGPHFELIDPPPPTEAKP